MLEIFCFKSLGIRAKSGSSRKRLMSSLTETIEKTRPKPSSDLHADRSGASELVNLASHSLTNYSVGM